MMHPLKISDFILYEFDATIWSEPIKWDETEFVKEQLNSRIQGNKAVDCIATTVLDNQSTLWLAETTDYRPATASPRRCLINEFCQKFRDTLAGLMIAGLTEESVEPDIRHLGQAIRNQANIRLVAHLEGNPWPDKDKDLYIANLDTLKQKLKLIDAHVLIGDAAMLERHGLNWKIVVTERPHFDDIPSP